MLDTGGGPFTYAHCQNFQAFGSLLPSFFPQTHTDALLGPGAIGQSGKQDRCVLPSGAA